jgi:uncharacterized protein YcbK (DUF882 family)
MVKLLLQLIQLLFAGKPAAAQSIEPVVPERVYKISLLELNKLHFPTDPTIDANLLILLDRINQVRDAYGKPMTVTSGLRSDALQNSLIARGISKATLSNHLTGSAVDILDEDGELHSWTESNSELMEKIGLWMENRQGPWQHYQIVPPHSGNRWFNP